MKETTITLRRKPKMFAFIASISILVVGLSNVAHADTTAENIDNPTYKTSDEIIDLSEQLMEEANGDLDIYGELAEDAGATEVTEHVKDDLSITSEVTPLGLPTDIFHLEFAAWDWSDPGDRSQLTVFGKWFYRDDFLGAYGPENASALQFDGLNPACWRLQHSGVTTFNIHEEMTSWPASDLVETWTESESYNGVLVRIRDGSNLDLGMWAYEGLHNVFIEVHPENGYDDPSNLSPNPKPGCEDAGEEVAFSYNYAHFQGDGSISISFGPIGGELNISGSRPLMLQKSSSIFYPIGCDGGQPDSKEGYICFEPRN